TTPQTCIMVISPHLHSDLSLSFFCSSALHRDLHSFPTRRSSDLVVAETLLTFDTPVRGRDGTTYEARACGGPMDDGRWQGWIEFVPIDGGRPVRSPRETTQPNRMDTEYWATGLTTVYLEGALQRALDTPLVVPRLPPQPSI